jgi:hypothetical protein
MDLLLQYPGAAQEDVSWLLTKWAEQPTYIDRRGLW